MQVIKVRRYKAGYEIRTEQLTEDESAGTPGGMQMKSAYTPDGHYIGNSKWAHRLIVQRGIKPELASPGDKVCSVGFCEKEQKWYGWSHRAIYGFGVGSLVVPGDCGYMPANEEDFELARLTFWESEHHARTWTMNDVRGPDGEPGVQVKWKYNDTVPNKSLRGTVGGAFSAYPEVYGRGEWMAETLAEAREMACDFAEGVG